MVRWGSAIRLALMLLCVIALLAPAPAAVAQDPAEELDRVEDELEGARDDLRGVERRRAAELEDLERVDARLSKLNDELQGLNDRLAVAEGELAESSQRLAQTTARLVETENRLADTRRRLEGSQDDFDDRARSTYMYGAQAKWPQLIAGIDSVEEFQRSLKYARAVLHNDQERVERISALEATVERTTDELAELQEQRGAQRAADQAHRDEAAEIVARREAVTADVAAQAERHRAMVAELESDRRTYLAMVTQLEAEGQQLETQLRRRAEAEAARRRAAAAAGRAPAPAADVPPQAGSAPQGALVWPTNGPITSPFGWRTHPIFGTRRMHNGMDIAGPSGSPIVAATAGVVVSAGPMGGYGNAVVIDHGGGMATFYAHQASVAVSAGQQVSRGQLIGYVGSTGFSTGPHLHFEVRINGTPVDPAGYL